MVKGQQVIPQQSAKILGVVMDSRLRFKEHIANAATKGLNAALALKRLRGLPPSVSRQLFTAVVTPRVDYASTVWAHACTSTEKKALDRVQKIGAQAITGAFKTVATTVAEAEANIATTQSRHSKQALKMWIKIQTLPPSHPLAKLNTRAFQRFVSPLQRIARNYSNIPAEKMETITPFALAPWEPRLQVTLETDRDKADENARASSGIVIATSSSQKNGLVGIGLVIDNNQNSRHSQSQTLAMRSEQNPYTAELHAIDAALRKLPETTRDQHITVFSSNRSALQTIAQPKQQSG